MKSVIIICFLLSTSLSTGTCQSISQIEEKIQSLETQHCKYPYRYSLDDFIVGKELKLQNRTLYLSGKENTYYLNIEDNDHQYSNGDKDELINQLHQFLNDHQREIFNTQGDYTRAVYSNKKRDSLTIIDINIPNTPEKEIDIFIIKDHRPTEILSDPSFENYIYSRNSHEVKWNDCGINFFPLETPAEVQPNDFSFIKNQHPPSHGKQYIALVTRETNTWEMLGKKLNYPMQKGSCYKFQIDVRTSPEVQSYIRSMRELGPLPFNTPIKLKINLSHEPCTSDQVIFTSALIENSEWETIHVEFQADDTYQYIMFESFGNGAPLPNGNVMIDNIRGFESVVCEIR